jgi:hypothetical protein
MSFFHRISTYGCARERFTLWNLRREAEPPSGYSKDGGGRSASQGVPSPPRMDICIYDGRPPGSSGKRRLKAPATIGHKKDIHIPP